MIDNSCSRFERGGNFLFDLLFHFLEKYFPYTCVIRIYASDLPGKKLFFILDLQNIA